MKVIEYNERKISLPANLDNIITYQFRYSIAKKDIKLVVLYFYLYLAIFCYLLDSKDYYNQMSRAINPYGDGKASIRIADILEK